MVKPETNRLIGGCLNDKAGHGIVAGIKLMKTVHSRQSIVHSRFTTEKVFSKDSTAAIDYGPLTMDYKQLFLLLIVINRGT